MSSSTFVKHAPNAVGEAAGLAWLAKATASGGANIVTVQSASQDELVLDYIKSVRGDVTAARTFGAALAHTHAAGARWWGCPPDGWPGQNSVGNAGTPLVLDKQHAPQSWGEFYAQYRIEHFTRDVVNAGHFSTAHAKPLDRLAELLAAGEYEHPQPELVQRAGHQVARCHGDMWAGNVLYDGGPTGATLIDPMAHGGHAETDLATLSVFGFPYLEEVYAGYDAASPLAPGWEDRVGLHQLGIVVMHAHLFAGPYIQESLALASRYL